MTGCGNGKKHSCYSLTPNDAAGTRWREPNLPRHVVRRRRFDWLPLLAAADALDSKAADAEREVRIARHGAPMGEAAALTVGLTERARLQIRGAALADLATEQRVPAEADVLLSQLIVVSQKAKQKSKDTENARTQMAKPSEKSKHPHVFSCLINAGVEVSMPHAPFDWQHKTELSVLQLRHPGKE